ncbi:restriction endonuclease subunit S, partial [Nitrosomonas oligotropha]|uniref:restriction endonuclease subunit S n=1 Tax=Nitrosomonas oligotropha TaxID=42354 RepID=UPI0018787503
LLMKYSTLISINLSVNNPEISYTLSNQKEWRSYSKSVASLGVQANIGTKDIKQGLIPLPPTKAEQTSIANALSDADALIQSLTRLIAKKRQIKQGTMQTLLNPYENGRLKAGWVVKKLGSCLQTAPDYGINAPAAPFSLLLPKYIRITDISENGQYLNENCVSVNHPCSHEYFLQDGELVFARTGASVGKTYLYDKKDGKLVFAGFLIRIKPDKEKLNSLYFKYYTQTVLYWNWVVVNSMRTGQPGINGKEYSNLPIYIPSSIDEQTRIATILSGMDAEIAALEAKLAKYRHIKQGMMQNLLTGRIRLVKPESNTGAVA